MSSEWLACPTKAGLLKTASTGQYAPRRHAIAKIRNEFTLQSNAHGMSNLIAMCVSHVLAWLLHLCRGFICLHIRVHVERPRDTHYDSGVDVSYLPPDRAEGGNHAASPPDVSPGRSARAVAGR
eukprot:907672-Pleurochrysis_carterae.AAC.1